MYPFLAFGVESGKLRFRVAEVAESGKERLDSRLDSVYGRGGESGGLRSAAARLYWEPVLAPVLSARPLFFRRSSTVPEEEFPLSNTPEHLRAPMPDTGELRLGKKLLKTDGSSKMFDVHELHAKTQPEMFKDHWEPKILDDSLVTKTDEEIQAERLAAEEKERRRLMEIGEQKSRKFIKAFFIAGGAFLAICAIVLVVVLGRK